MGKKAVVKSQILILVGPYEGQMATVERVDRRGDVWAKINRGPDAGEKTRVVFAHYKIIA